MSFGAGVFLPQRYTNNTTGPGSLHLDFLTGAPLDSRITFSRTTNATLVDSTGRVTYAPNNLVLRSEEFENAFWTKANATVTANATAAPNGTTTADAIIENTATATHGVTAAVTVTTGVSYIFSVYAKQNGRSLLRVGSADSQKYGVFDLIAGVVQYVDAGVSASITPVGDGWYRCAVTERATLSGTGTYLFRMQSNTSEWPGTGQYTGNGTSGVFLWGAQFEAVTYQTLPSTYVQTVASAYYAPRFDYNPVTLAPRGLLIEEQRVNLVLYSEQFDNAGWTKLNGSVTANTTTSPDGTANADAFIENTAASAFHAMGQAVTKAASSIEYAGSFYVKDKGRQVAFNIQNAAGSSGVQGRVNPATGTVTQNATAFGSGFTAGTITITNAGNGWYRVVMTATSDTSTTVTFQLILHNGTTSVYTGDGVSGAFLYGAQLEAGAFATSYIPTVASTVTRAVDVASMTGTNFSSWYNASEGTLFAAISSAAPTAAGAARRIANINNGTESNRITVAWAGSTGVSAAFVTDAGATQANFVSPAGAYAFPTKVALAYKANDFQASVNGTIFTADTSGSIPTVDRMTLGDVVSGGTGPQNINGHLSSITYYATRLTNAQLQALTS